MRLNANQKVLVRAFRALTDAELENLIRHVQLGTPICCGKEALLYIDGYGGG